MGDWYVIKNAMKEAINKKTENTCIKLFAKSFLKLFTNFFSSLQQ